MTAEEIIEIVDEKGVEGAFRDVDVVTCGTFSPMCSSGAFLNFGHSDPPIRMSRVWLNDVPACAGLAAVDAYIGATELSETAGMEYGGAHVIEDLIAGRKVRLKATSYGTDCYPRRALEAWITKDSINEAYMFNPRNCYQNYGAATNSSDRTIYTYMGTLLPHFGNVNYCTAKMFFKIIPFLAISIPSVKHLIEVVFHTKHHPIWNILDALVFLLSAPLSCVCRGHNTPLVIRV